MFEPVGNDNANVSLPEVTETNDTQGERKVYKGNTNHVSLRDMIEAKGQDCTLALALAGLYFFPCVVLQVRVIVACQIQA